MLILEHEGSVVESGKVKHTLNLERDSSAQSKTSKLKDKGDARKKTPQTSNEHVVH